MTDDRPLAAIILAGGQGARMGGIDKPGLSLGGSTLRARALSAASAAGLSPVIHVGPDVDGGPVAALAAGIARIAAAGGAHDVVVLAGDLVDPARVIAALCAEHATECDGAVLVDPDGREQWLAARYRIAALVTAISRLEHGPTDASLRAVTSSLALERVRVEAGIVADIDSWEDYETAKGLVDG